VLGAFRVRLSFNMFASKFLLSFAFVRLSIAGYVLQDSFNPTGFFDNFDFFTGEDPTQGFGKNAFIFPFINSTNAALQYNW
jgi:hypothetical protein